jgi:leucyl-tRNA synthetase
VRWLNDVWAIVAGDKPHESGQASDADVRALNRKVHQTIQKVTEELEVFGFNTAVAALMSLKNTLMVARKSPVVNTPAWDEAIATMLTLMAPFTIASPGRSSIPKSPKPRRSPWSCW